MRTFLINISFLFLFSLLIKASTTNTIQFSGITWDIKSGSALGPGPNNWTSNSKYVFVDANGDLHLTIKNIGGIWYCTELVSQQSFGYGEYKVVLGSNTENYDKNIIVGIFTYETDTREIDIEFSRWGNSSNPNGWYTVQPVKSNSQRSFPLNLTSVYSTHKFVWTAANIAFDSYQGNNITLPSASIKSWVYTGIQNPPAGGETFRINFWLMGGNAPSNGQDAELIIKSISILTSSYSETISPSDVNLTGAQWNIDGGEWQYSGVKIYVAAGPHTVNFKEVTGYITPPSKNITILPNVFSNGTTSYEVTSINSVQSDHFSLYPNPCKDNIDITSDLLNQPFKLTILNVTGEIVYNRIIVFHDASPIKLADLSCLSKGVYFMKLQSPVTSYIQRFIKE